MIQLLATPPNTFFTRLLGVPFSFYSHCRRYVSLLCNKYFKFHTPWLEFLMFCWVGNFTRQVPPTTSLPLIAFFSWENSSQICTYLPLLPFLGLSSNTHSSGKFLLITRSKITLLSPAQCSTSLSTSQAFFMFYVIDLLIVLPSTWRHWFCSVLF